MNPPTPTRRSLLATLGASACVVGFNAVTASWVSAAEADAGARFEGLPPLAGTLYLDRATRDAYAQDFGDIVHELPLAVLRPGAAADIRAMLDFARRHGIRIVGRGRGHTAFGQSQLQAGIVIDVSSLQTIHRITGDRIDVDAGIHWNALLDATLRRGLMPPALTDYIGQTVGGTLSVGGVGGMTQRHGAQVDNVLALQVATGAGELVACSASERPDLFDAILAGQGQVGVIVRATLRLAPAPARIRVFDLIYPSLPAMTSDMRLLMEDQRFEFQEAFAIPQPDGSWAYLLQAGSYYSPPAKPDADALLAGLQDVRSALGLEDHALVDFANRVPVDMPVQPHPWIDLMLPYSQVDTFVGAVEQTLKPLVEGDTFTILLIPMRTDRFSRPLFRAPDAPFAFGFGILRYLPDDKAAIEQALVYNRMLFDQCRDLGGTHYPISAVKLEREDWVRHYGTAFDALAAAKARYDPANVIGSGPDIF
jgi:FAD/FMN-containing dehydrogenase